ncbi:nickel transporter [Streptomyces sp. FB2]|uniref:nickel transporter n=1 Tax=Streptomyces sp. FB2 TaxID=2902454 RepID=UPI001F3D0B5D|nr:nickel transporter [Streptomyces sp. FB2]MCF2536712.1 nickel transporter [Streptomyces sp. FB2]
MSRRRLAASGAAVLTAACALALFTAPPASAHPLGNFTVNRYDGLVVAPGELRVAHVEDLAEIPATQAGPTIEKAGLTAWARQRCANAARDGEVTVDGREAPLTVTASRARVRPGQAGLDTLRVECALTAPLPERVAHTVEFTAAGGEAGPGWREITARGDRMTLTASDVPGTSASGELSEYPEELLSSPADTRSASLRVRPGGPALTASGASGASGEDTEDGASSVLPRGADRWTRALDDLVSRRELTVGFAALALLLAVFLGALHALAPGHGKTMMAAVATARGGRARMRDVLPLAASVTVTHTLGVVALGLLVTAGSAAAPSVITWLGVASGALVIAAGVTLTRRAWHLRASGHGHSHGHEHPHDHDGHPHPHPHPGESEPEHAHERHPVLVGASPGTAPAPHPHPHDHAHPHPHDHVHEHDHDHAHEHGRRGKASFTHTHGGVPHTHSTAPTLRGTILLGFAGGLVPSPSAVVVLVGAAALGKAWFGLLLVVAYGAGLALTLGAAGFAVVRLGTGAMRVLDRRPRALTHPVTVLVRRTAPLASAVLVVLIGAGLVVQGAASALG